ncbi:2-hydroxyacid dehydrogenase [Sphingobacterium psychroaquaticum]|uniref:Lactate dehydrogenase n=1 Tax=Sphingobacterium psychroaquaticum TaxID=561061 RepID=A0A1X7JL79_9SPHI|nr:D-glycerate dehydrogenase [Sphingobacterium psychroaquaticum]QBQ40735.1 D-glycerate dehydrogenase [Sphingobacterium psychroaquaticum]SMG28094.1 Lactate dehydrogenase [Sphingobacterium psychroaquaticum]
MRVFISRNIPEEGITYLKKEGLEVIVNTENKLLTKAELIAACQNADLLLNVGHADLDADFISACQHLKGIALASVGYDHISLPEATKHGIAVSNTPDVLSGATADTAFLLMLAVSRKAFYRAQQVKDGEWRDFEFMKDLGIELNGKTLGIFGMGRIGIEMAKKAKGAYNMNIIYHNRSRNEAAEKAVSAQYVNFDDLLTQSDVISAHSFLSPETTHIFNADAFKRMKKSAIFINTARGKIHQEAELTRALEDGEIWGAGLDVTDPEPMLPTNPLLKMPNVCVLPHIGSATIETRTQMALLAASNLVAVRNDVAMPQILNPEVYG